MQPLPPENTHLLQKERHRRDLEDGNARQGAKLQVDLGDAGEFPTLSEQDLKRGRAVKKSVKLLHSQAHLVLSSLSDAFRTPLSSSEEVCVLEGWNKALAFHEAVFEATTWKWMLSFPEEALSHAFGKLFPDLPHILFGMFQICMVEFSQSVLKSEVAKIRPQQTKAWAAHQRLGKWSSTYFKSSWKYFRLFSLSGVMPGAWISLGKAFHFALETHAPYLEEAEKTELEQGFENSCFGRFFVREIAKPALQETLRVSSEFLRPDYVIIAASWEKTDQDAVAQQFVAEVLEQSPDLGEYFPEDAVQLVRDLLNQCVWLFELAPCRGETYQCRRDQLRAVGKRLRSNLVPTSAFPALGIPLLRAICRSVGVQLDDQRVCAVFNELFPIFSSFVTQPLSQHEVLLSQAQEFLSLVAQELEWDAPRYENRLRDIRLSVANTGTYSQTYDEIAHGCRVAWRNSTRCIGRISWKSLVVRDSLTITEPEDILQDCVEHLRVASAGPNLVAVMTVFRPKHPNELVGLRIWNSQLGRYAGYRLGDGSVMGDPANLDFTDFLIRAGLWVPPSPRSHFDVLPLALKVPHKPHPVMLELPEGDVLQCPISHPTYPDVAQLGLRWFSIPAISNFTFTCGGLEYTCCPFNGWFVELEIVRNLLERYQVGHKLAEAIGVSASERMWMHRVKHELSVAVCHSFDKAGVTIQDQDVAGQSFMTHCQRERTAGRECPAKWDWIGGFTGPLNPTWHHEMREYDLEPNFHYCGEHWRVSAELGGATQETPASPDGRTTTDRSEAEEEVTVPRVLILYGSETGTAENVAFRLQRVIAPLRPTIAQLNDYATEEQKRALCSFTHVVIVTATFGAGEAPSNASEFLNGFMPSLHGLRFAVLAFGSSVYSQHFAKYGSDVFSAFQAAGAEPFLSLSKSDGVLGHSSAINQFIPLVEGAVLSKSLRSTLARASTAQTQTLLSWTPQSSQAQPLSGQIARKGAMLARVVRNDELIQDGDVMDRSTRLVEVELPEMVEYKAGDHMVIYPRSDPALALRLATLLGCQEHLEEELSLSQVVGGVKFAVPVPVKLPARLRSLLSSDLDLSLNEDNLHELIALIRKRMDALTSPHNPPHSPEHESFAERISCYLEQAGSPVMEPASFHRAQATLLAHYPTMIHLLECCPVQLSISDVLPFMKRLAPRLFSIASSGSLLPKVQIVMGVLNRVTSAGVTIRGVCSHFVAPMPIGQTIEVAVRASSFHLPEQCDVPLLFVCAGTGLAPIMGMLQELQEKPKSDHPRILMFGCRNSKEYIQRDELERLRRDNVLSALHVAMSREPSQEHKYVQDLIRHHGKEIAGLLEHPELHVFVCGDIKVGHGVQDACVKALSHANNSSKAGAHQKVQVPCFPHTVLTNVRQAMMAANRWHTDLWGSLDNMERVAPQAPPEQAAKARWSQLRTHVRRALHSPMSPSSTPKTTPSQRPMGGWMP